MRRRLLTIANELQEIRDDWTDDAYPELDGDWTDEELMIAAGNAAFARNRRKHTETEEGGE